jgi:asparagine N-glycosylation enzyme membrane subunit Stt3
MKKYFFSIATAIIFLLVFMGIPYIIGSWWHLLWSWIVGVVVAAAIDENAPKD